MFEIEKRNNLFPTFWDFDKSLLPMGSLKTDISEKDGVYNFEIEVPGYNKEDITVSVDSGYLTVEAVRQKAEEEKDNDGKILRRERVFGKVSRSFYVGNISDQDVEASLNDGILLISCKKDREKTKIAIK